MSYLETLATIFVVIFVIGTVFSIASNCFFIFDKRDRTFYENERKNFLAHIDDGRTRIEILKRENLKLTEKLLQKNLENIKSKGEL